MLIVGVWAITAGIVEIAAAFGAGQLAGTRATFILGGLASAAFGVVLCARPGIGVITLALLFGLFNLIAGTWMLAGRHRTAPDRQDPAPPRGKRPRPRPGLEPGGRQAGRRRRMHPAAALRQRRCS